MSLSTLTSTHPSLEQRLEQLAKIAAELGKPTDCGSSPRSDPMGFWDALTGRTKPKQANLDALFSLPQRGDHPADRGRASRRPGRARSASGPPRARRSQQTQDDVVALLDDDPTSPDVERQHRRRSASPGWSSRRARRHRGAVHRPARRQHRPGGAGLRRRACCARWSPFADRAGAPVGLVYLYKQGTFYPFAPTGPADRATTCWRSRSGTELKAASCRWSRTSTAGCPLGRPRPVTLSRRNGAKSRRVGTVGATSAFSRGGTGRAGRASAAARPWPSARSRGRPRSG